MMGDDLGAGVGVDAGIVGELDFHPFTAVDDLVSESGSWRLGV